MMTLCPILLSFFLLLSALSSTSALRFTLEPTKDLCIYDIIEKDVLSTGEYALLSMADNGGSQTTRVMITVLSPGDKLVFKQDHLTEGKFTFTATERGLYKTCFVNKAMITNTIEFYFKVGAEAKDLQDVIQLQELKPIEAEMLRLKHTMLQVRNDLQYLKQNEAIMRDMNENTNSSVAKFSYFTVIVCLTLGIWQVFHLRNYFKEKKMI